MKRTHRTVLLIVLGTIAVLLVSFIAVKLIISPPQPVRSTRVSRDESRMETSLVVRGLASVPEYENLQYRDVLAVLCGTHRCVPLRVANGWLVSR
jgi:hypothetical protein